MSDLQLNPLFSERTRLLIMATLASARQEIDFSTLVESLQLTRGNLSTHMRKLEEAGFVEVEKGFVDRKPRTTYRCTPLGRRETKKYLRAVEDLLSSIG